MQQWVLLVILISNKCTTKIGKVTKQVKNTIKRATKNIQFWRTKKKIIYGLTGTKKKGKGKRYTINTCWSKERIRQKIKERESTYGYTRNINDISRILIISVTEF